MPYLVFDGLGRHALPSAARLRRIIRAILERNYAAVCPPDYVEKVVASVKPDRYRLRAPRYLKSEQIAAPLPGAAGQVKIALVVNDKHDIHHVHDRGYVEAPVRVGAILGEIERANLFRRLAARRFPDRFTPPVHDSALATTIPPPSIERPSRR